MQEQNKNNFLKNATPLTGPIYLQKRLKKLTSREDKNAWFYMKKCYKITPVKNTEK